MSAIEEAFGVPAGFGEPSCRPRGGGPMGMDTELASKLLAAAWAGDAASIRALVPRAGSPEVDGAPDAPGGVTPLMAAAAGGHEAVVEALLERGADAAKRDARGRRAAAHARAGGHPCLAKRLDTVVDKDQTIW